MRNDDKKANIICLSNQLWDYPLRTNKKHVMSRLALRGNKVLFVDPPINTGRLFFRQVLAKKWSLKRLFSWSYEEGNATIFSPLNYVPANKALTLKFAKRINELATKKFDPNLKTILWVYHVEMENLFELISHVKHDILVYDCVDNYSAFPRYNSPQKQELIIKQEEKLTKMANIVFATAPGLVAKLERLNSKTFYMPNVGDYARYSKVKEYLNDVPEDLVNLPRPRIAFTGAIDEYKFDADLVKKLALDYPSYSFVIIGPKALKDRESSEKELGFEKLDNVYFLGTKDYTLLPKYFASIDAMIIPYKLNDYTVGGCFPVKFHDALAAGLPVIVTDLPAYRAFEDVCYISKSHNDFIQNVRRAVEEDNDQRRKDRMLVAKSNDWEGKVDKMISLIDAEAGPL